MVLPLGTGLLILTVLLICVGRFSYLVKSASAFARPALSAALRPLLLELPLPELLEPHAATIRLTATATSKTTERAASRRDPSTLGISASKGDESWRGRPKLTHIIIIISRRSRSPRAAIR